MLLTNFLFIIMYVKHKAIGIVKSDLYPFVTLIKHKVIVSENCSMQALGQTVDWFRRALAVEPVKGNLRLSGYSACGQDGGVQLPREYVEGMFIRTVTCSQMKNFEFICGFNVLFTASTDGVADTDLVLLVTTRPTTGNTLAWAVACERDQWGRAIAGHVNVAPRHLTAEAETLLSATLIHEVSC